MNGKKHVATARIQAERSVERPQSQPVRRGGSAAGRDVGYVYQTIRRWNKREPILPDSPSKEDYLILLLSLRGDLPHVWL